MTERPHTDLPAPGPEYARRQILCWIGGGAAALGVSGGAVSAAAVEAATGDVRLLPTLAALKGESSLRAGDFVCTLGRRTPGDGGGGSYEITTVDPQRPANDGDVIALNSGFVATLLPDRSVNYVQFGTVSDGQHDDGVPIRLAHEFAARHRLPIVQPSGEFWIKESRGIPIVDNVDWGNARFHIDEKFNIGQSGCFIIESTGQSEKVPLTTELKAALLEQVRPGAAVIPALLEYRNRLVSLIDQNDQIGCRSGEKYTGQSWAREELLLIEERGRVVGDIAWTFRDLTELRVGPAEETVLTVRGGGFLLSGDSPVKGGRSYVHCGIGIRRSRTVVRDQWVGLEDGRTDVSRNPRSGFYSFSRVHNVTLENVRLVPFEYARPNETERLRSGTYGISGSRMLNTTFRTVTADGDAVHWGVFGTNINKNLVIEDCRFNRVDVHFHCWNLNIRNSEIGISGISVTGGGRMLLENVVVRNNTLVNLRNDFGARWDGPIAIRDCTLAPRSTGTVSVIQSLPQNFDYCYPIGCARAVRIENLVIDYSNAPASTAPCWMLALPTFGKRKDGDRLFFPESIRISNVQVQGRSRGVRLFEVAEPEGLRLLTSSRGPAGVTQANCRIYLSDIMLEDFSGAAKLQELVHLRVGRRGGGRPIDEFSLIPELTIERCQNVQLNLTGAAGRLTLTDCAISRLQTGDAAPFAEAITLHNCRLRASLASEADAPFRLEAEDGVRLTDCTIDAPLLAGKPRADLVDTVDVVRINTLVRHQQTQTSYSTAVLEDLKRRGVTLTPAFIAALRSHHSLDAAEIDRGQ